MNPQINSKHTSSVFDSRTAHLLEVDGPQLLREGLADAPPQREAFLDVDSVGDADGVAGVGLPLSPRRVPVPPSRLPAPARERAHVSEALSNVLRTGTFSKERRYDTWRKFAWQKSRLYLPGVLGPRSSAPFHSPAATPLFGAFGLVLLVPFVLPFSVCFPGASAAPPPAHPVRASSRTQSTLHPAVAASPDK